MSKAKYIQVGRLGKAHGLKGELRFSLEDHYIEDVLQADAVLVGIGNQRVPYFIEAIRKDTLLKFEEVDDKAAASLLQHKDVFLPANQVTTPPPSETANTPYDALVGFTIQDATAGKIGTITEIIDLPQHYLAQVNYQGKTIMVPLHADLIAQIDKDKQLVMMDLPEGLLEL